MALLQAGILLLLGILCFPSSFLYTLAQQDCEQEGSSYPCNGSNCTVLKQNLTKCCNNCQYDNTTKLLNMTFSENSTLTGGNDFNTTATLQNNITSDVDDKCKDHPAALNCLEVLEKSPKYCAIPRIHQMCCRSCQRIISSFPAHKKCKIKHSSSKCPKILSGKPQLCYNDTVRLMCCHLCDSILTAFEGSKDVADVTELIKRTSPNSTIICQNDSKSDKLCHIIILHPDRCSNPELQQKCCKTCEIMKSPETDVCQDDPKSSTCRRRIFRFPWFCEEEKTQNKCCKSCENVITSLPALDLQCKCPIKPDSRNCIRLLKRKPQLCRSSTEILKECCRTCEGISRGFEAQKYGIETYAAILSSNDTLSDIACLFKKDAPDCLREVLWTPQHCANSVIQKLCCQTCKSAISGFPVLNFTDTCQNESDSPNCHQYIKSFPHKCSDAQVHKKCCNLCESVSVAFKAPKNMTNILSTWQKHDVKDACQNDTDEPNCVNLLLLSPNYCAHPDIYRMCCYTCDKELSKFPVIDTTGKCHKEQESRNCLRFIRSNPRYCTDPDIHEFCCRTCQSVLEATRDITKIKTALQGSDIVVDSCINASDSSLCQELISLSPRHCENPDVQKTCCNTCESLISNLPVTDVTSQCQNQTDLRTCHRLIQRHPQSCNDPETLEVCCLACEHISKGLAAYSIVTRTAAVHEQQTATDYAFSEETCQDDPEAPNCMKILKDSPKYCTIPGIHQMCCQSCLTIISHLPAYRKCNQASDNECPLLLRGNPQHCYKPAIRDMCCHMCESIIAAFEDAKDLPNVTASVQFTDPSLNVTCEDETDQTFCHALWMFPHYCTNLEIQQTCCKTCKNVTASGVSDTCEEDPMFPDLCNNLTAISPNSCLSPSVHKKCCPTCENIISNFPEVDSSIECPNQGEVGSDCPIFLKRYPHYCRMPLIRNICCKTCAKIDAGFQDPKQVVHNSSLLQTTATMRAYSIVTTATSVNEQQTTPDYTFSEETCHDDPEAPNCMKILKDSPKYCAIPKIHQMCCQTCLTIISDLPVYRNCNRTSDNECLLLLRGRPQHCYQTAVREMCCHICESVIAAFEDARDLPNVTAAVRSTDPTLTLTCQDGTGQVLCHLLWVFPQYCMDPRIQQRCCKTCKNVTLNDDKVTCEEDPAFSGICKQIISETSNYCLSPSLHEKCCPTCENLISSFPEVDSSNECPNQDKDDSWCALLLGRYPHYCEIPFFRSSCCQTCVKNDAGFQFYGSKQIHNTSHLEPTETTRAYNFTTTATTLHEQQTTPDYTFSGETCQDDPEAPYCMRVLRDSPKYCAIPRIHHMCCRSCLTIISDLPVYRKCKRASGKDCPLVLRGNPQYCFKPAVREICCHICESIMAAFKVSRDLPNVTAAVQSTDPAAVMTCRETTQQTRCHILLMFPQDCINPEIQQICCKTCRDVTSSVAKEKCREDPTFSGICKQINAATSNYCLSPSIHKKCCPICENIISSFPEVESSDKCPDQDDEKGCGMLLRRHPQYCEIPALRKECCQTCMKNDAGFQLRASRVVTSLRPTTVLSTTTEAYSSVITATSAPEPKTTPDYKFSKETCQDDPEAPYCMKVLTDSPKYCAVPRIHQMCCQSCLSIISNLPEYKKCDKDSAKDCSSVLRGNPHYCYKPIVRLLCCHICESIMAAFEGARDLPNVAAAVRTSDPTLVTCQDDVNNNLCPALLVLPHHCANPQIQQSCCKSCRDVTKNKDTCEEDPTFSDVCKYATRATSNYCLSPTFHKKCCPFCKSIISSFPEVDSSAKCPKKDNEDSDCPVLLMRYPHYCNIPSLRTVCCHTCMKNDAGFKAF